MAATVKYRWLLMAILLIPLLVTTLGTTQTSANAQGNYKVYLPLVMKKNVEFRGLWITRFDWTGMYDVGSPARIDEMVNKAADANFNVLLFQVRGTGDAFYTPGLEPWSARLNSDGVLGRNPGWDPLAFMIEKAHAKGLKVHAYVNTFPTWYGDTAPPSDTTPKHPFQTWSEAVTWDDWRVWDLVGPMNLVQDKYLFASPAAPMVREHIKAVVLNIAQRYQVDGIHLDYIRYPGSQYSWDPYTQAAGYGYDTEGWKNYQRQLITSLVGEINQALPSNVFLSAAVWPVYKLKPEWGLSASEGYYDYYQDSQRWVKEGNMDAIMPMLYPADYNKDPFALHYEVLVSDFVQNQGPGRIVAGVGAGYSSFDEITYRINIARQSGALGHSVFSYGLLQKHLDYWALFTAPGGPHQEPAIPY